MALDDDEIAQQALAAKRTAQRALPAIYIDTWSTLTWKGHVRVVLGEEFSDFNQYRSAFVMDLENAEDFANHLLNVVRVRKEKDLARAKKLEGLDPAQES